MTGPSPIVVIERTIVDFLEVIGHEVREQDGEWWLVFDGDDEFSITALACAIHKATNLNDA